MGSGRRPDLGVQNTAGRGHSKTMEKLRYVKLFKNIILPFSFTSYSFSHRGRYFFYGRKKKNPISLKLLKSLEGKWSIISVLLLHFSASNKLLWNYMQRLPSQNIRKHLKALESLSNKLTQHTQNGPNYPISNKVIISTINSCKQVHHNRNYPQVVSKTP